MIRLRECAAFMGRYDSTKTWFLIYSMALEAKIVLGIWVLNDREAFISVV